MSGLINNFDHETWSLEPFPLNIVSSPWPSSLCSQSTFLPLSPLYVFKYSYQMSFLDACCMYHALLALCHFSHFSIHSPSLSMHLPLFLTGLLRETPFTKECDVLEPIENSMPCLRHLFDSACYCRDIFSFPFLQPFHIYS